jgi:hypothetical protein
MICVGVGVVDQGVSEKVARISFTTRIALSDTMTF